MPKDKKASALGPCGEFINELGHMLVYYATEKSVTYIDCQNWTSTKQVNKPFFSTLAEGGYEFVSPKKEIDENTFGQYVFFAPMNHCSFVKTNSSINFKTS